MYSLRLSCTPQDVDRLSAELWERGTSGIRELELDGQIVLIAGFEDQQAQHELFFALREFCPVWNEEAATDWVAQTEQSWPAQDIGQHIFLVPPWNRDATPLGRIRIVLNPGLACGTGRHPCSQLALIAIEHHLAVADRIADIGTGSGILAVAALKLGAAVATALDVDESALASARQNFALNGLEPHLVCGSADCMPNGWADIAVANISATVLVSITDDLLRITRHGGWLILTGFHDSELSAFTNRFPSAVVTAINEWRCVTVKLSSVAGA